ncbi:MAG: polyamine aminopropyltransferase [Bacteroidetes bacterium]|nr:MAG: polyamine aminopropyltransferase [Bacteroidota bacterium]
MTTRRIPVLLTSVFIIATCGILYELLISTISSYFQGSSILHFSLVIGLFLSFMGVGSYLSRYLEKDLLQWFIRLEILLSLIGGGATFLLYLAFSLTSYFYGAAFLLIALLGTLIGIEIPILTRVVRQYESLRDAMAKVLSFDYLGALLASVAFPLILLPTLGTMRTAFVVGLLNLSVAVLNTWLFRAELPSYRRLLAVCGGLGAVLLAGFIYSFQLVGFFEQFLYRDEIMLSRQSAYQQIVLTRWNKDVRLFLNGNLQFSSRDEYRYHEPLVHLPMQLALNREQVLILGGGDGLAVREVLRYPGVEQVTVVDLDPEMTRLGQGHPALLALNEGALNNPRVKVVNEDAYGFVEHASDYYDVVIIDLPDPHDTALGKLYAVEFYELLAKRLSVGGVVITQSTSPYFAREAFWCIHHSMNEVFPGLTLPVGVFVPSFGPWGFNLAMQAPGRLQPPGVPLAEQADSLLSASLSAYNLPLRYLHTDMLEGLFVFDGDMAAVETERNRLENQVLIRYYEASWAQWR